MRRWAHLVCAGRLAWLLALLSFLATPTLAFAGTTVQPSLSLWSSQHTIIASDRALSLRADAPAAPAIYGAYSRFGIAVAPAEPQPRSFLRLQLLYSADLPAHSAVRMDVRASADGLRWSAWEVGLASGDVATFARPAMFAQYRATLLGNGRAQPSIRDVRLRPIQQGAIYSKMSEEQPVAPTWKLRATRQGMVGGRTANGHRITKRDRFVSLPSWRALSPDGTTDYQVRITYNGRSAVAPVYDVGPWNAHDNYWDEQRERYQDLPRGWPEDHAAYYDDYNNGRAEKGRVRFPTAVDIGDGVWWDDLGIKGDQATVEITFLWLGSDPLAPPPAEAAPAPPPAEVAPAPAPAPTEPALAPPPVPAEPAPAPQAPPAEPAPPPAPPAEPAPPPPAPPPASEVLVDNHMPSFKGQAIVKWYDAPANCGANGHALWTYSTTNPADAENSGEWRPALAAEALYDVYAYIPSCAVRKPNTTSARYLVHHRDGDQEVVIDQVAAAGTWVLLGRFPFRAGDGGSVALRDVTGDRMRAIWFDAIKWVPAS